MALRARRTTFPAGLALAAAAAVALAPSPALARPSSASVTSIKVPATPGALATALAQAAAKAGDVELRLEAGVHAVAEPLVFTSAHASLGKALSVVADDPAGPAPSVSGGVAVKGPWARHPTKAGVWTAAAPAGVATEGARMQAWRGAERLTLARTPDLMYAKATPQYLVFKGSDVLPAYADMSALQLVLYESWTASIHHASAIHAANKTVYFTTSYNSQWANSASGSRYYVQNAAELLDSEGEFYVDAATGQVMLHSATDPSSDAVVLAVTEQLVVANGTAASPVGPVSWHGVAFEHTMAETATCFSGGCDAQSATFLTTAAVNLFSAAGWSFSNCTWAHTGGYGLWFNAGTSLSSVTGCAAHDLGAGGIRVGMGAGSTEAMVRDVSITDNVLNDGGHVFQEGCGVISQNSVDNITIAHNEISYFRYTGVSTGWTWGFGQTFVSNVHTEFNHIFQIGMGYLSDFGCVYTLGHQPGSRVVNNLCSDTQSYNYGGWAYYTDEGSRDEVFTRNIAVRTKCAGHHQHYGTDNLITNNLYYHVNIGDVVTPGRPQILMKDCDTSIRASTHARPASCHPHTHPTTGCCCAPGCDQGKCSSFNFTKNVVYQPAGYNGSLVGTTFWAGLINFTFASNDYYVNGLPATRALWNTTSKGGGESMTRWQATGKDSKSVYADPLVEDTTSWQLAAASPALKLGFEQIDVSAIGPRLSEARTAGAPGRTRVAATVRETLGEEAHAELHAKGFVRS